MDEKNFQNHALDPKLISLRETVSKSLLNPNKPPFIPKGLCASLSSASLVSSGTGTSTNDFSLSDTLSTTSTNSNASFELNKKNVSTAASNSNNNINISTIITNIKNKKIDDQKSMLVDDNNNSNLNNSTNNAKVNDVNTCKNISANNINNADDTDDDDLKSQFSSEEVFVIHNNININISNNSKFDDNNNKHNRQYNQNLNSKNINVSSANYKSSNKMHHNKTSTSDSAESTPSVSPTPIESSTASIAIEETTENATPIHIPKASKDTQSPIVSPESTSSQSPSSPDDAPATISSHRENKNAKHSHHYTIEQLMKLRPARLKPKTQNSGNTRPLPVVLKSINLPDFEIIIGDSNTHRSAGQLHHNHHNQHHQHNNKAFRNSNNNNHSNNGQSDISILPKFAKTVSFTKRSQGNSSGSGNNTNSNNSNNSKFSNKQSDINKSDSNNNTNHNNNNNNTSINKINNESVIKLKLLSNEDIKLNESENAWKPKHLEEKVDENISEDDRKTKEILQKFRSILNKLTPDNFNVLIKQVHQLNIDSVVRLDGCIDLVFEKAIAEPNFSVAYAQMCKEVESLYVTTDSKGKTDFRTKLITLCQNEFENHSFDKQRAMSDLGKNVSSEVKQQMDEKSQKIRRRAVGTVRFIGELYKSEMLVATIMHKCILLLLQLEDEESLECLCKLLTTIGGKLETTNDLSLYFATLQKIVNNKGNIKVSSRIRFMIQDLIDLKNNNWQPRNIKITSNPKTMNQIAKEVETEINNANYQQSVYSMSDRHSRRKGEHSHNNSSIGGSSGGANTLSSNSNVGGSNVNNSGNKNSDNRHNNSIGSSSYSNSSMKSGNRRVQTVDGWSTKQNIKNRISFDQKKINNISFLPSNNDSDRKLGQASNYIWNRYREKQNEPVLPNIVNNRFAVLEENGNASSSPTANSSSANMEVLERERKISRDVFPVNDNDTDPSNNNNMDESARSRAGGVPISNNTQKNNPKSIRRTESSESNKSSKAGNVVLTPTKSLANVSISGSSSTANSKTRTPVMNEDQVRDIFKKVAYEVREMKRKEFLDCFLCVPSELRWIGVSELLNCNLDTTRLDVTIDLIIDLLNSKLIKHGEYLKAIQVLFESLEDLQIDSPTIWKYTGKYIATTLYKGKITLKEVAKCSQTLIENNLSGILIKSIFDYMEDKYDKSTVIDLWSQSNLEWSSFLKNNISEFIKENNLEYVTSD